ncbi:hypothetical protein QBC38DRAFT_476158 [Podospora fimiseda]|uniref:Uncharacterized protein n=1 Tax=Podospora fimiseda TaxID=252190 RepID=A0AAN7BRF5_9PEZI|nr:hypothetical protein QBC38DRAFT_476158 [Podospora fimiseda]
MSHIHQDDRVQHTHEDDRMHTIPHVRPRISHETLTHLGLTSTIANEIWDYWTNFYDPTGMITRHAIDPPNPWGFPQLKFHVMVINIIYRALLTPSYSSDWEWFTSMKVAGLSSEVQAAIMDPNFTYLWRSRSLRYWIHETLYLRWTGLLPRPERTS